MDLSLFFPGMLSDCLLGLLFLRCHLYFKRQISHFRQKTSILDLETPKTIVRRCVATVKTDTPNVAGWAAVKMWQHDFQGSLVTQVAVVSITV